MTTGIVVDLCAYEPIHKYAPVASRLKLTYFID